MVFNSKVQDSNYTMITINRMFEVDTIVKASLPTKPSSETGFYGLVRSSLVTESGFIYEKEKVMQLIVLILVLFLQMQDLSVMSIKS